MNLPFIVISGWAPVPGLALPGADYRRYQREGSAFFPWFPNNKRSDKT
jgi:steroid 5-alpha reductase family enzyme